MITKDEQNDIKIEIRFMSFCFGVIVILNKSSS